MKIYIVTCGEYSDYCVLATFLDKSKAEAFVEKYDYTIRELAELYKEIHPDEEEEQQS